MKEEMGAWPLFSPDKKKKGVQDKHAVWPALPNCKKTQTKTEQSYKAKNPKTTIKNNPKPKSNHIPQENPNTLHFP